MEDLLAARPALRGEIGAEHYVALHRAAEVGRILLDAGSPLEWEPGGEPSASILEIVAEWRRDRSARTMGASDSRPGAHHA